MYRTEVTLPSGVYVQFVTDGDVLVLLISDQIAVLGPRGWADAETVRDMISQLKI